LGGADGGAAGFAVADDADVDVAGALVDAAAFVVVMTWPRATGAATIVSRNVARSAKMQQRAFIETSYLLTYEQGWSLRSFGRTCAKSN
jgi:hypothetical protein